jgi:hypothetical protein
MERKQGLPRFFKVRGGRRTLFKKELFDYAPSEPKPNEQGLEEMPSSNLTDVERRGAAAELLTKQAVEKARGEGRG